MGLKVLVRENETVESAMRRFKKLLERHRVSRLGIRSQGPFCWMLRTKEYYQKPSLFKRMKRVRRLKVTQQGTPPSPT